MKYALPTDDGRTVGKVFGRAKSFAFYNDADSSYVIVANEGAKAEHGAGTGLQPSSRRRGSESSSLWSLAQKLKRH